MRLVSVCLHYLPSHHAVQSPASEEPIDLFSLRVQVDVVETGPCGQTRDRGHLGGMARESSFYDRCCIKRSILTIHALIYWKHTCI